MHEERRAGMDVFPTRDCAAVFCRSNCGHRHRLRCRIKAEGLPTLSRPRLPFPTSFCLPHQSFTHVESSFLFPTYSSSFSFLFRLPSALAAWRHPIPLGTLKLPLALHPRFASILSGLIHNFVLAHFQQSSFTSSSCLHPTRSSSPLIITSRPSVEHHSLNSRNQFKCCHTTAQYALLTGSFAAS